LLCSLAQTPANFGPKSCFGMLFPEHMLYNNFKLVASVAAEINRGGGRKNLVVPNVEEPHIYRSGVKKIVNAIILDFTSSQ